MAQKPQVQELRLDANAALPHHSSLSQFHDIQQARTHPSLQSHLNQRPNSSTKRHPAILPNSPHTPLHQDPQNLRAQHPYGVHKQDFVVSTLHSLCPAPITR